MNRLILFFSLAAALAAGPAHAEWRKAESQHFVVYSDGSERSLREYTAKLERFDQLLTSRFGGADDEVRRLPVYLVGDARALRVAVPGLPAGIAGYYSTSDTDVFAILVRGESDDILLHEYSHHAMARAGDVRYPGWFREGFAEFFATATVSERGEASFGLPDRGRLYALQRNSWLPMDAVLRAESSFSIEGQTGLGMFYAQSWALTHWLLADTGRIEKLPVYFTAVNSGRDPVEAWQEIFAMTSEQLATQLRSHVRGRLTYAKLNLPPIDPEITVTSLSPAADVVLLPAVNARSWNPAAIDGPALLTTLRAAAERFPDDPLALVAVGRAEKRWGDEAAAETALARALEIDDDNVEGLILMADMATERGLDAMEEEERNRQWALSRDLLGRALQADATDARVHNALMRLRHYTRD